MVNARRLLSESVGSDIDTDAEDNDFDAPASVDPQIPNEYDPSIDDRLPDTVTLLTTPEGGKLYLIGTAHFSVESQDDVSTVITINCTLILMINTTRFYRSIYDYHFFRRLFKLFNLTLSWWNCARLEFIFFSWMRKRFCRKRKILLSVSARSFGSIRDRKICVYSQISISPVLEYL